jgi:hypothetical protein
VLVGESAEENPALAMDQALHVCETRKERDPRE